MNLEGQKQEWNWVLIKLRKGIKAKIFQNMDDEKQGKKKKGRL